MDFFFFRNVLMNHIIYCSVISSALQLKGAILRKKGKNYSIALLSRAFIAMGCNCISFCTVRFQKASS